MRKTKIICTLGPATDKGDVLRQMMLSGMNIARFNFSHGSYEEHKGRLEKLIALRKELNLPVAALLDTKGPEIRLKKFKNGTEQLKTGQHFTLTNRDIPGTNEICSVTYAELPQDVAPGATVMLDDGLIQLKVLETTSTDLLCEVENSGTIKDNKGINVPGSHLSMPYMSQRDKQDILFAIENGYDFIAASFVRSAQDVYEIRRILNEHNSAIRIIAKIENREGVDNIDEILAASDGVMVARGDLGVEIDFTEIPMIQKSIIDRSFTLGKPIITATQMLDSMIEHPRPTRAEITDVANAICDGTSAIMLSGETAAGLYPVESVKTMSAIAERTEGDEHYLAHQHRFSCDVKKTVSDATAHAACTTAQDVHAAAILTVTKGGITARLLSKYRPEMPIIACVMDAQVRRQLQLCWGVSTLEMQYAQSTDEMISKSVETAEKAGLIHAGETVVVTAGVPVGLSGTTNMIKVHLVGDCLCSGIGIGEKNACGKACVCHTLGEVKAKFRPGMVLCVPETSNDMLSYMKDAAAILTEEDGMNSHAAIVGLALGKAVVIGAAGAMTNLRDGLEVTVDCAHGTVRSMQD